MAQARFLDQVPIGVYQPQGSGGNCCVDIYQNGILVLKTMIFKTGIEQSDYITKTIPFNYEIPSIEDINYVKENLKKICNY